MKEDKFYINCPYEEKDLAKTLGAKWDSEVKSWYVPEGLDQNRFKKDGLFKKQKITKSHT